MVIKNRVLVSKAYKSSSLNNYNYVSYFKTSSNSYTFKHRGAHWCLMKYIDNSITLELVTNSKQAFEAGQLYGHLIFTLSNHKPEHFHTILPNFHNVKYRYKELEHAIGVSGPDIQKTIDSELMFCQDHLELCSKLDRRIESNEIPIRITHNDTKLSNILFSKTFEGMAVIDTDTVMPGCVAHDFGDAVRTICSNAKEDETNLDLVDINLELLHHFTQGFSKYTKVLLTKSEVDSLLDGILTLPYLMGLRFLTDHINGNKYFNVKYQTHNLDRARNQFKLLSQLINQKSTIEPLILKHY